MQQSKLTQGWTMSVNTNTEASPSSPTIYCRHYSYCLTGSTPQRCGECGRQFDVHDPETFSYDPTHTSKADVRLSLMKFLHRVLIINGVMFMISLMVAPEVVSLLLAGALLQVAFAQMALQTAVTTKIFGQRYALGNLIVQVIMIPLFMIGFIVVPLLIIRDIERRWRP